MTELEILKLQLQYYIRQERKIIDLLGGDHKQTGLQAVKEYIKKNKPPNMT